MLTIRMQRTGRKGHAMFRVVVQDSRRTPTSGKVVALLGSYDPHAKTVSLTKDKATFYLEHGAQPSLRVARLLQREGVTLPSWVKLEVPQSGSTRNPEKLRKNRLAEAEAVEAVKETPAETPVEDSGVEVKEAEATPEVATEVEEVKTEEPVAETAPAEASKTEEPSK